MDKELVLAKLESLYRCIQRVESQHITSLEELQLSLDKQDIAILNLERGGAAVCGHCLPYSCGFWKDYSRYHGRNLPSLGCTGNPR